MAIDANPDIRDHWLSSREGDLFMNIGIRPCSDSNVRGRMKFYRFKDTSSFLNTLDKSAVRKWIDMGHPLKDVVDIDTTTLYNLGKRIKLERPDFSPEFLNLDVEQVDFLPDLADFLQLMSFPELVCIEWVSEKLNIYNFTNSPEFRILEACGYQVREILGGNIFASNNWDI